MAKAARAAAAALLALLVTAGAAAPAGAACPNEALRQQQGVLGLPNCMALEMVTPPSKANRRAGQVSQGPSISAGGDRVQFESPAPLGDTDSLGSPTGDYYIASRGPNGWTTRATTAPAAFGYGWAGVTTVGNPLAYTADFDRWVSLQNTISQAQNGQMTAYEADLAGVWTARSALLTPLDGHHGLQSIREIPNDMPAVSPDLSRLFVRAADAFSPNSTGEKATNGYSTAYLPGDPQPTNSTTQAYGRGLATWNTYVLARDPLGAPTIALLARDSVGKEWGGNCGAFVGGGGGGEAAARGGRNQGAVSADGTSVYFSTRPSQPQADPANPNKPVCEGIGTVGAIAKGDAMVPNVVAAKGTGTTSTSAEPNVMKAVSTTAGAFAVGQTATIVGSTIAAGTTITAVEEETETLRRITLSNPVTAGGGKNRELRAGAFPFSVGEEIKATSSCNGGVACFETGTTIASVSGQSITVSPPPKESGAAGKGIVVTPPLRIMHRTEAPNGDATIEELIEGGPAGGEDFYEGASADQSRVYFTTTRKLAASDVDPSSEGCSDEIKLPTPTSVGCDLYLYEELPGGGSEVVQVSAGGAGDPSPGVGANVYQGLVALSTDGSHAYFAAQGVLTTDPNPEGDVAQAGELNLYLYEREGSSGSTRFVGELDSDCGPSNNPNPDCAALVGVQHSYWNNATAVPMKGASGGDGHVLAFVSTAPLTSNDQDGKRLDAFRYDAAQETLECVSCLPGGLPDAGAFDVRNRAAPSGNPGPEFAERERWASEDGNGIVFATAQPLLFEDVDGKQSDYLWQEGQLTLLPSSSGNRPTISADGEAVAFETSTQLLPAFDGDSAVDVYMARVDGGFPNPTQGTTCAPPSCQGSAVAPPPAQGIGSQVLVNAGNRKVVRKQQQQTRKKRRANRRKAKKQRSGKAKRAAANRGGGRR